MTVRSKSTLSADIVDFGHLRHPQSRHRLKRVNDSGASTPQSATLLSIRQHLNFKASVAIDDFEFIESRYSAQVANQVMTEIRSFLNEEFGHLRVHRHRHTFVVSHHSLESMIGGLLRVQFYSNQIALPVKQRHGELSDICGVPLSWGVGHSLAEAENERQRRVNLKRS